MRTHFPIIWFGLVCSILATSLCPCQLSVLAQIISPHYAAG